MNEPNWSWRYSIASTTHPRVHNHFYLSLLGTHTAHHGSGIGMGLLTENLARIDEVKMPAYLIKQESREPSEVPISGFRGLRGFRPSR